MLKILSAISFNNPFPSLSDGGTDALRNAMTLLFRTLGAISVIVIIYAGVRLSASRGNPDAIGKLRSTIIYAAIGLLVSIGAAGILGFVQGRL